MSPIVIAAIISTSGVIVSAGVALTGVVITIKSQTRHIDTQNRTALTEQTNDLKAHLGAPPIRDRSDPDA